MHFVKVFCKSLLLQSPKKKKKKTASKWTGEIVFINAKIDDYRISHPDMEEKDIEAKLLKVYKKQSAKKQVSQVIYNVAVMEYNFSFSLLLAWHCKFKSWRKELITHMNNKLSNMILILV